MPSAHRSGVITRRGWHSLVAWSGMFFCRLVEYPSYRISSSFLFFVQVTAHDGSADYDHTVTGTDAEAVGVALASHLRELGCEDVVVGSRWCVVRVFGHSVIHSVRQNVLTCLQCVCGLLIAQKVDDMCLLVYVYRDPLQMPSGH